jgi:hypothetical protein
MITEKIQGIGAKCWLDEKDLDGGDVIAAHIIRGIDACDEAVVLISSNTVRSPWVSFEIGGVRAQHKRVTPILNKVGHDELSIIKDIKSIDLNKFEQFLAQLQRRITKRRRKA